MANNRVSVLVDVVTDRAAVSLGSFKKSVESAKKSVQEAEGAMGKFRAGSTAAMDVVKANAAAFAISAGTALVAFGVKAVGAFTDLALAAGKFSDATGIAVDDASRLIEVAGDLGVNADTVQSAIQRMNKSLADGKAPTDELTDAIVRGKDGTVDSYESFIALATSIGKIKAPTLRAKAAQETFGKSYGEIAELMSLSADELRQKLGAVSDQKLIDPEELAKARKFREALDGLKDSMEDVSLAVGEVLTPLLSDLAEVGTGVGNIIDKVSGSKGGGGLLGLLKAGYDTLPGLGALSKKFETLNGLMDDGKDATDDVGYSFGIAGEKARRASGDIEELEDATEALEEQAERTEQAWASLKGELAIEDAVDGVMQGFDDIAASAVENFTAVAEGQKSAEQAARDHAAVIRDQKQAVIDLAEQIGGIPPSTVVEINALIDQGAFDEAERQIQLLLRRRDFPISPRVVPGGTTPKFATGTSSFGGGTALVGEQGPELVSLPSGSSVASAGRTQQLMQSGARGAAVVQNITINAARMTPNEIVAAIEQHARRNGGR